MTLNANSIAKEDTHPFDGWLSQYGVENYTILLFTLYICSYTYIQYIILKVYLIFCIDLSGVHS